MNKWFAIISLFFLTGVGSCKPKTKCDCSNTTVCVSVVNSSGQSLETLKLVSDGVKKAGIGQLAHNNKTCMAFNCSGENTFSVTAILKNGKAIKSGEVYCEGGYEFIAIATEDDIKVEYSPVY